MVVKSKKKSGRGHKISTVKRSNQKRTKLVKQGKLKVKRNKRITDIRRNPRKIPEPEPTPEIDEDSDGEDMRGMVEQDDIDFLKDAVSAKSYSMLKRLRYAQPKNEGAPRKKRSKSGDSDDEMEKKEEEYEDEKEAEEENYQPVRELLPIKTKEGLVRRTTTEKVEKLKPEPVKVEAETEAPAEDEAESEGELEFVDEIEESRVDLSQPISTAQMLAVREIQLKKFRLSIGSLASGLLEDPASKMGNFKHLLAMLSDTQPAEVRLTVPRLAAVSLLEVFKDILPEYQIKHVEEEGIQLKKVTLELRSSEKVLLNYYKNYLAHLEKLIEPLRRKGTLKCAQSSRLGIVALDCLAQMLDARPAFNFAPNLVRLLVPFLDHRIAEARDKVAKSIASVLKNDRKGEISLEIVRRINALVKTKQHAVRPECLTVLLSLRIKDINLDKEKTIEMKQRKVLNRKQKMLQQSKRERKRNKRMEELNKELLETQAEENKQTKQKFFTEVTKLVFTIFFRVLKSAPTSSLLSATLEGLAKFAHCINVEFYQDLVKVLEGLLTDEDTPLATRHQLLCVQTVFTILSGQGEFLTIDPTSFYAHLYRNLLPLNAGRTQVDLQLALETLTSVMLKRRKTISQQRLLAFTKRLSTMALQQLHNGALGCLQLVKIVMQLSRGMDILLEPDSTVGQGVYMPELNEPEYCNAGNTALYELAALMRHYHPVVRQYSKHVGIGAPGTGEGILPPALDKLSALELYEEFDPSEVAFKPTIPTPKHFKSKSRISFNPSHMQNSSLRDLSEAVLNAELENTTKIDFFTDVNSPAKKIKKTK